jgi:hypothetical protein
VKRKPVFAFQWQHWTFSVVDNYIYVNNNKKESIVAFPREKWWREAPRFKVVLSVSILSVYKKCPVLQVLQFLRMWTTCNWRQFVPWWFIHLILVCLEKYIFKLRFVFLFVSMSVRGKPRMYLNLTGFLYLPLRTFHLWPLDAPAPTDASRTPAVEVGTYGRGIRTDNLA